MNPRYESASSDEKQGYQEALYLIILDSFRLSSQSPTDEEIALRATAWVRHLMGLVPENDLQRCFDRAFADHDSAFPVSAYDMKAAHDAIIADERKAEEKKREERRRQLKALETDPQYRICDECYGSGWRYIRNPKDPDGRYVVKCSFCDYWFNRRITAQRSRSMDKEREAAVAKRKRMRGDTISGTLDSIYPSRQSR